MGNRLKSSPVKWYVDQLELLSYIDCASIHLQCCFVCCQEIMYSKWFCDGDVREAQAQMLPKKVSHTHSKRLYSLFLYI